MIKNSMIFIIVIYFYLNALSVSCVDKRNKSNGPVPGSSKLVHQGREKKHRKKSKTLIYASKSNMLRDEISSLDLIHRISILRISIYP